MKKRSVYFLGGGLEYLAQMFHRPCDKLGEKKFGPFFDHRGTFLAQKGGSWGGVFGLNVPNRIADGLLMTLAMMVMLIHGKFAT